MAGSSGSTFPRIVKPLPLQSGDLRDEAEGIHGHDIWVVTLAIRRHFGSVGPIFALVWIVAIAIPLLLIAHALWNGYPLLQYDTGGYLARWYERYLVPRRSTAYGT